MKISEAITNIKKEISDRDKILSEKLDKNKKLKPRAINQQKTIDVNIVLKQNHGARTKKSIGFVDFKNSFQQLGDNSFINDFEELINEVGVKKAKRKLRKVRWVLITDATVASLGQKMKYLATSKVGADESDGSLIKGGNEQDIKAAQEHIISTSRQRIRIHNNKNIQMCVGNSDMSDKEIIENIHEALSAIFKKIGRQANQVMQKMYIKSSHGKALQINSIE